MLVILYSEGAHVDWFFCKVSLEESAMAWEKGDAQDARTECAEITQHLLDCLPAGSIAAGCFGHVWIPTEKFISHQQSSRMPPLMGGLTRRVKAAHALSLLAAPQTNQGGLTAQGSIEDVALKLAGPVPKLLVVFDLNGTLTTLSKNRRGGHTTVRPLTRQLQRLASSRNFLLALWSSAMPHNVEKMRTLVETQSGVKFDCILDRSHTIPSVYV